MKLHDQHLHSWHSIDSKANPLTNCKKALESGLSGLTFTEHFDIHPTEIDKCKWHYETIYQTINNLRSQFQPQLTIGMGIEVDFQLDQINETLRYLDEHQFDLVLLSVHWADGRPLHKRNQWNNQNEQIMQNEYFKSLLSASELCLNLSKSGEHPFDILSHLDYVKRYLINYWKKDNTIADKQLIKQILSNLIAAEVIPEINTSGMRRNNGEPYPSFPILEQYFSLGGTSVSIGSDSHQSQHIGFGFQETAKKLASIGFTGEAVFTDRKKEIILFEFE